MGCGLLAITLLLYFNAYINFESVFVPRFLIYVFFIVSLLSILRRFQNKKLIIGFILTIICLILSMIELNQPIPIIDIGAQFFYYFQIYFVLYGVIDISEGYDWLYKIKKKTRRFLINLAIIYFIFIYVYITNHQEINSMKFFAFVLFIQLFGLSMQMLFLNNYLYSLDEPIKELKVGKRTAKKSIIAIVVMAISAGTIYCVNDNLLLFEQENKSIQFEYFIYSGQSENIIVDGLRYYIKNDSQYYGDDFDDIGYLPTIYLKKEVFERTHVIEFKLYNEDTHEIIQEDGILTEMTVTVHDKVLDESRYIAKFDDYVGIPDTFGRGYYDFEKNLDYNLSMHVELKNKDYEIFYQESIPLQRQDYKEYGYEDEDIKIFDVYATDTSIVYGPSVFIKDESFIPQDKNYGIYTTFIIDGKEHIYSHSNYGLLKMNLTLQEQASYVRLDGQTITLRIHFTEPKPNGKEYFYKDYVLEEIK